MRDTIAMLEQRVAATRVGRGGVAQMPIARSHRHSVRSLRLPRRRPATAHAHVVVSNKVQGIDGRWRTLDSRRPHKAAVAPSETYNAFVTDHTARLPVMWVPVDACATATPAGRSRRARRAHLEFSVYHRHP